MYETFTGTPQLEALRLPEVVILLVFKYRSSCNRVSENHQHSSILEEAERGSLPTDQSSSAISVEASTKLSNYWAC